MSELASARRTGRNAAVCVLLRAALLVLLCALARPAAAQQAKGEVTAVVENGFARLVFTLAEDVDSQVKTGNGIIVIAFQRPVAISVDKLAAAAGGYISAVRRDPDGRGIRIALARKVTVNSMAAAERLFVDLLPDTWSGLPPGLPREVIEDLARRAREADKKQRQQRSLVRQSKMASIRVRVASQPTFTRYIFELPELIGVAASNQKDKLTLTFDALLKFDLADAKATLPDVIGAIDSEVDQETVVVRFTFAGKVDVRTFREDLSFIVDVTPMQVKSQRHDGTVRSDELSAMTAELAARTSTPPAGVEAPPTMPAHGARAGASEKPAPPAAAPAAPPASAAPMPAAPAAAVEAPPPRSAAAAPAAAMKESPTREGAPAEPAAPPTPAIAAPARAEPPPTAPSQPAPGREIAVAIKRQGDNLSLVFPFAEATPGAVFVRGDMLWLLFDTDAAIKLAKLDGDAARTFKAATVTRHDGFAAVRLRLTRPLLASASTDGPAWVITVGGEVLEPPQPIVINRNIIGVTRASVTIPFDEPRRLHRLEDPEAGDALMVVTALGPTRGLLKSQDFVEFRALASIHGLVVLPIADDVEAEFTADRIVMTRPSGMILSAVQGGADSGSAVYQPHVLDMQVWTGDRQADFRERSAQLLRAAADAPEDKRAIARAELARFYLARDMAVEAKAVLDVSLADNPPTPEDPTALVLRAVANLMLGRLDVALKDLSHPLVGNQHDAPLWRALVHARQGRWNDAREGFRAGRVAIASLPVDMQRLMLKEMVRASIEVGDITGAVSQMHDFEAIGIPREYEASLSVLSGRIAQALGRPNDALRAYQAAADSWDRPAASQARLRQLVLQRTIGTLPRGEALNALEILTSVWRGDETEVEALQLLARLYTDEGRYRDAFQVMRTALAAHPNSEVTRRIHEEGAETFVSLFLAGKGDALPPIEALGLFYDFRDLTPIGRRGDEMIRRLADRLVAVDLLGQAAELLQHQVDHRLQGAARAQVATRLALVYLMNRKPDRAVATLRTTRAADLSNDLRSQRLMLEARALSDLGRHDVALEIAAEIPGPEAARLRADIMWAGRRWREAAEQIELLHGERWSGFEPLTDDQRRDILRAAIGYVLGDDQLGLARLRERYAAKMGDGPDRRAFEVVTAPVGRQIGEGASDGEFREIARAIASVDTLAAFLRDLRARFPDEAAPGAAPTPQSNSSGRKGDPATTGTTAPMPAPATAPAPPPIARTAAR